MGAARRPKNGEWEKNRREKLNLTFLDLSQLLPGHDSTISLSKVEVLKRAIAYILDLKKKISGLVEENCSDTYMKEMELIKKQLNELKLRNQQLADLLKTAEIKIPDDPSLPNDVQWAPPRKWACKRCQMLNKKGKIIMNKSGVQDNEEIKSKENSNTVKLTKAKTSMTPKIKSRSKKFVLMKSNLNAPLRDKKNNIVSKNEPKPHFETKSNKVQSKTVLFSSQPITLPCTTVSLVLSYPKSNLMTVAKSAPIMATGIQPVLKCSPQLSALGPGTLIMPDGRIVPVPPAPIIVNRPAPSPALILMQNIPPIKPPLCQHSRPIAPKTKDSTKTTYVVKVPIPTISADKNVSNILANSKNLTKKISDGKSSVIVQKPMKKKLHTIKAIKTSTTVKENKNKSNNSCTSSNSTKTNVEKENLDQSLGGETSPSNEVSGINKPEDKLTIPSKRNVDEDTPRIEQAKRQKIDGECCQSEQEISLPSQSSLETPSQKLVHSAEGNVDRQKSISKSPSSLPNDITPDLSKSKDSDKELATDNDSNKELSTNNNANKNNSANNPHQDKCKIIETEIAVEKISPNKDTSKPILNTVQRLTTDILQSNENTSLETSIPSRKTSIPSNLTDDNLINNNPSLETNITQLKVVKQNHSNVEAKASNSNSNNTPCVLSESTQTMLDKVPSLNNASQEKTKESSNYDSLSTAKVDNLKKPEVASKKLDVENKLVIHDENQELSGLFSSDPKLQTCSDSLFKDADFRDRSLFMPINHSYVDEVRLSLPHSDFSNDLFSSLQVPTGGQHPESISPTAAFLLAFPLVSTSKTAELLAENDGDSQHGTPTTILQIGNIDPPGNEIFHQNSLIIENNVPNLQENLKINKSQSDHIKPSNTKPIKDVESFDKFQRLDIIESTRNENYTKTFKEKKSGCSVSQDSHAYLPCKKKVHDRNYNYSLHSEVIPPHFQEKSFDCPVTSIKQNNTQSMLPTMSKSNVSLKKCHNPTDNFNISTKNNYSNQSQSYNYNTFTNDLSLPSGNYFSTTQMGSMIAKTSQAVANLNSSSFPVTNSWSTSIVPTANSGGSHYCAYPQRSYVSSVGKNFSQKGVQGNFDDQGIKDRSVPNSNLLPKFSNHFNFNNNHLIQENHINSNFNQIDSAHCKIEHKTKKQKTSSQRGPVNWMTTPDIRPVLPDPNLLPVLPDVMFHPQKEQDFNSTPIIGNASLNTSNNITSFSVSTPSTVYSSSQSFHHNNHFTGGIDFQLDFASFSDMACSSKHPKTVPSVVSNHPSTHYSISPTKNNLPLLPHIDSHMIPSTLPTLVGDLALGTTTPMDTFKSMNMPTTTPFNLDTPSKKCDIKMDSQKTADMKPIEKDCYNSSERKTVNRNVPDFYQKTQIHQSTNTTSSFLSVSQLVDPVKSDQTNSRRGIKQVLNSKTSTSVHKRNTMHQPEKQNHMKVSVNTTNNIPNSGICQSSNVTNNGVSKKLDAGSSYQDDHTVHGGFTGSFGNNISPPWQNNKAHRSSSQYKGSYSAESLIGDHSAPPQDQISDLPVFSQYSHTPIVSSGSYTNSDFTHQNMQPLEFHQPHHSNQNCFNFPTHNSHYSSSSYNAENEYVSFDTMYGLNNLPSRVPSIPHNESKQNRNSSSKRSTSSKRKEEFSNNQMFGQAPQIYHPVRTKGTATSSPNHSGTTSLTNFNLSTIFPEINDKRAVVQGSNSFHSNSSKHTDNSSTRSNISTDFRVNNFNSTQMQQPGVPSTPQFPPVTFANPGPSLANFRSQ